MKKIVNNNYDIKYLNIKNKIYICANLYSRFINLYFEFYDIFMSFTSCNLGFEYKKEQYIREYNFKNIFLKKDYNKIICIFLSKLRKIKLKYYKIINYLIYTPEKVRSVSNLKKRGEFEKYWSKDKTWNLELDEIECLSSVFNNNSIENFVVEIENLCVFLEEIKAFFKDKFNKEINLNYEILVTNDLFETNESIKSKSLLRNKILENRIFIINKFLDLRYADFWNSFFDKLGDCYLNMHIIVKKLIENSVNKELANKIYAELLCLMITSLEFNYKKSIKPSNIINVMRIITGVNFNSAYSLDKNYVKNKKFTTVKTVKDFYYSFKYGENPNFFEPFRFLFLFYPKSFVRELNCSIHILCSVMSQYIKKNICIDNKINMLKTIRHIYVTLKKTSYKYVSIYIILRGFIERIFYLISLIKKDINSSITKNIRSYQFLGKGGYGKVILYYNSREKRKEAVKILREDKNKAWDKEKILKLSSLKSENIAKIYSLTDDEKFLSMEYVEGRENYYYYLYTIRNNNIKILDILIQIVKGLKDLSYIGYYHNDLDQHTNNILISKDKKVKIIDYDQAIFKSYSDCNKDNAIKQVTSILYFFRIDLYKKFISKFENLNFIMGINKTNYPYVKKIIGDKLPSSDEIINILKEMIYSS